jgi:hypothetical protein
MSRRFYYKVRPCRPFIYEPKSLPRRISSPRLRAAYLVGMLPAVSGAAM